MSYYYLIAGLPDLRLGMDAQKIDFEEVLDTIRRNLVPTDEKLFRYLLHPNDNRNLLNILFHTYKNFPKAAFLFPSIITEAVLQDYHRQRAVLPAYMSEFLDEYEDQFAAMPPRTIEAQLWRAFYEEAEKQDAFINNYFQFDRCLKEIAAAYNASHFRFLTQPTSESDIARGGLGKGRTVPTSLLREYPYIELLGETIATYQPNQIEQLMDQLRWSYLEETTGFFGREQVFVYVVKLLIVIRWHRLVSSQEESHFETIRLAINNQVQTSKSPTV
ncbi:DUF2764 family protein [Tunicatimonas pelagia]|uniref:DUF2764 family protein n=1 Tax=Tunicatimonas pelagia TaxID=931531 RepID=UPI0026659075|nr:DUF2764 family protein [Tunicatimonas pelagia]WKN45600.1 DUF2764 family protein [Tunicatimonas pelagia]